MGHVNTIENETFDIIKNTCKNITFSQWYEDNLTINGPDFQKNFNNLKTNFKYIDNFFISTHPDDVSKKTIVLGIIFFLHLLTVILRN